ncbi:transcription factor that binds to CRE motif [Neophaeococcomyces mojaviensis]|uniref:Transcription factor that binds to CRE motif n=1 Tax=Neophaeococcomyces mojaviensis TaxID=3383035 RepID=A0ACC3A7Q0_9EURO|nr:transcription factor that binds to CRE motif [Knufia sp. JES_112]
MDSYVDASEFDSLQFAQEEEVSCDYPSPSASSDADHLLKDDEPSKKKRKAWGQPVPEIVPILPPRKRAKTAEEKEQRKNERILRNRRAADKSRQRQKAAQAELEQQNKDLAAENAQLKALLKQHGLLGDFKFATPPSSVDFSIASPMEEDDDGPTFSADTPAPSLPPQESPTLAPTLDLNKVTIQSTSLQETGMTQYPAVVLCDLQCQPVLDSKLRFLQPSSMVNTVLTLIHYLTIAKNSLTSTLSPISRVYQILEQALAQTSTQLESIVLNNFELIHILISMPSTSTQPAVFRLKLLSRLLACNPSLAPLLTMAADRALQQRLSEENWTTDPDHRWAVASLMTIKWSIRWLSREHSHMRMQFRYGQIDRDSLYGKEQLGVDCGAVERHFRLFDEIDPKPWVHVVSPSLPSSMTSVEAH